MALILVIDDDRAIRHLVTAAFTQSDVTVVAAEGPDEGVRLLDERAPDVVLLDVMLAGASGLDLFDEIHRRDPALPVVFITASEDSDTAIQAMKVGAYDYLLKPLDLDKVRDIVQRAVQIRRMSVPVEVPGQSSKNRKNDLLVGCGLRMQQVYKDIGRVAGQDVTVLIRGESGTGKELIARAIYQYGARAKGRFLAINCAAIPDALLESELFGHEKGSFTGADSWLVGKFEQCAVGTLFLY